jgi:hypothetical protein
MNDLGKLKKAILDLHGCESNHVASIPVHETFEGKTVWQGVVEVFSLRNHPKAKEAYAWSYKSEEGETRYVAILGVPPIYTAINAVRAYIVAEAQKQK